ncbi:MAG: hypothetical protein JW894_04075 [Bacteroidales bacterium]|nr:hypothetical protein [Bacteroidales bacterium]
MKPTLFIAFLLAISMVNAKQNDGSFNLNEQDSENCTLTELNALSMSEPLALNPNSLMQGDDHTTLGQFDFAFQPAGFLQFGPIVEFEFRVGESFMLGTHFRYSSLGLAYVLINDFDNTLNCFGIGFSFKHFPAVTQKNKFYYGIHTELDFGDYVGDDWYGTSRAVIPMTNVGYRFRFGSGFFINLGLFTGVYINTYDVWYEDGYEYDDSGWATFFGLAEFGLGVEF